MTICTLEAFIRYQERVPKARLGYVPAREDQNSRVHILSLEDDRDSWATGRPLCNAGAYLQPFEFASIDNKQKPCANCFKRAVTVVLMLRRKEEENPGCL